MENLSQEKSIQIIEDMINTAKREYSGAAYYLILWGSVVCLYCFAMFILKYSNFNEDSPWYSWTWILFPIGGILSFLHNRKASDIEKTKSWFDKLYMFVWGGFAICFSITCSFAFFIGQDHVIPFIIILYGFVSFVTGGTTKFYPSLIGSIICFICAIMALIWGFTFQFLFAGIAVFFGQIIPGIIMLKKYKNIINVRGT